MPNIKSSSFSKQCPSKADHADTVGEQPAFEPCSIKRMDILMGALALSEGLDTAIHHLRGAL